MASRCAREGLGWILGTFYSPEGFSSTGKSFPGQWWSLHLWRDLKAMRMWQLGTWFSGDHGSAGGMVWLGLRGLFHPKQFRDSVTQVTLGLTSAGKCREFFSFRTISLFWGFKLRGRETQTYPALCLSCMSTACFEVTFIRFLPLSRKSFQPKLDLPVQSSVALAKFPLPCYCPF